MDRASRGDPAADVEQEARQRVANGIESNALKRSRAAKILGTVLQGKRKRTACSKYEDLYVPFTAIQMGHQPRTVIKSPKSEAKTQEPEIKQEKPAASETSDEESDNHMKTESSEHGGSDDTAANTGDLTCPSNPSGPGEAYAFVSKISVNCSVGIVAIQRKVSDMLWLCAGLSQTDAEDTWPGGLGLHIPKKRRSTYVNITDPNAAVAASQLNRSGPTLRSQARHAH